MRLIVPPLALVATLAIPTVAEASPFAVPLTASELTVVEPPADTAAPSLGGGNEPPAADEAEPEAEPEAEAEAEAEAPPGDDEAIEPLDEDPTEGEDDDELEDELTGPVKKGDFNANAIGLRGGIHLVPSYFLNAALASYGNALCRDKPGNWGEENGLVVVDGCNFYVGGDYIRRISRAFDISVGLGYLHVQTPDSLWIDNNEWDRDNCTVDEGGNSNCNLGAADYTEIDLRMFTIEVNFIGRGTLYRSPDVEVQLGGGGGVGAGILIGDGVRRTPLGSDPSGYTTAGGWTSDSCTTLADTADFRKCTPRYYDDPDIDQAGDGSPVDVSRDSLDPTDDPANFPLGTGENVGMAPQGRVSTGNSFARCTETKCDGSDLNAFGATETGGTWPAYPLINIFGSFRVIVKDSFGISIEGGIKDGFFFGGGIQYYFGGGGKNKT